MDKQVLEADEWELWRGKPLRGGPLDKVDYFVLAGLAVAVVFAVVANIVGWGSGTRLVVVVGLALPLGLGVTLGAPLVRKRSLRVEYVLTNQRLFVVRPGGREDYLLDKLGQPFLRDTRPDGSGTVEVDDLTKPSPPPGGFQLNSTAVVLRQVPEAERVCALILDRQQRPKPPPREERPSS